MDRSRGASVEDVGQEESKRGQYRKIARPLRRVGENKSTRIESDPLQEAEGEEMSDLSSGESSGLTKKFRFGYVGNRTETKSKAKNYPHLTTPVLGHQGATYAQNNID